MNPIIEAILGVVSGPLDTLLARFFPSAEDRQKALLEIQQEIQKNQDAIIQGALLAQQAQIGVNTAEAASSSVFVAGWRPAAGWVCASALGYNFIAQPFLSWAVTVYSAYAHVSLPPLPTLDMGPLMTVLLGMLGLSASRTIEALQGKSRNSLTEIRSRTIEIRKQQQQADHDRP